VERQIVTNKLEGKVAIVTGAAGGIGSAYSRGLAEAGAAVVVADLNAEGAEKVAAELTADGYKAVGVEVDVTDEASVAAMVEAAVSNFGGVDILVNNAAMMSDIPKDGLTEVSIEMWNKVNAVNVTGPLLGARAVAPIMRKRGGGKIVNQSSAAAFLPGSLYRISKHNLVGLTAGLAVELGKDNINVNGIAPGLIMSEAGFKSAGAAGTEKRESRYAGIPHARPDRPPTDLVGTLLLLVSPEGDFIHGQTINVDGGWVIRL
jgi:NAD(P)-dependent dehydrogenase (short-subunit alcohol dehydrogenase family)